MKSIIDFFIGFLLIFWSIIYSIIAPWFPKRFIHKRVRNQIVLVTGGASGFGQLLAKKFALDHGAIVVVWDVNKNGLEQTVKLIQNGGGKCFSYVVDMSSKDEIYAAAAKVQKEVGKVDILINNAGIGDGQYLVNMKDEYIEKIFKINIISHFWTTKAFLPAMISTGTGHIVTISSSAGLFGAAKLTSYCATKHAAVGFHESLTNELQTKYPEAKIETTVVCPYFCRTPMIAGKEDKLPSPSLFLPIREPEPVVDEMMDAILTNEKFLIPSWGIRLVLLLQANLPSPVMQSIRNLLVKFPNTDSPKKDH